MKKVIPVLLGLIFLWISLYLYAVINNKSSQKALDYIPKESNFLFKLNSKKFFKSTSYSMLFNSKDQDLLSSFENFMDKRKTGTGKKNDFGIDFLSDVVVFGEKVNEGQNFVVVFELMNPELFVENLPNFLGKNQSFALDGNTGFILTHFSSVKINQIELKKYLNQIIKNKHLSKYSPQKSDFMSLKLDGFKINENYIAKKGKLISYIDEKELKLEGEIELENAKSLNVKLSLLNSGFHFETCLISKTIQDSIHAYLAKIGFNSPEIDRISINYYGVELQESSTSGLIVSPIFDLLLTFKKDFKTNDFLGDFKMLKDLGYKLEGNTIVANKINYFVDSIDSRNLFIGCHLDKVVKRKNNLLLALNGDATMLTSIKGGGFLSSIVQVLPPFKSSKNLFDSFQEINLVSKQNKNKVEIQGKIQVKENKFIYNEFLRFYLTFIGEN
jgi:hypothetical protein